MRQVVVIGGTGVIGASVASAARDRGLSVVSLSLDAPEKRDVFENIQVDVHQVAPVVLATLLAEAVKDRPVALLLDILGLGAPQAAVLAAFAASRGAPVALISSCLLYDHDGSAPVDESCPLAQPRPDTHPYIRDKLALEAFWRDQPQVAWRIFRCHHILGAGSTLGCIPNHNRDPQLLARLRGGEPLELARNGEVSLSWIHPDDLASAVLTLCANPKSSRCAINMVAPEPVRARDYYDTVARLLGLPAPTTRSFTPNPADFWSLTARDNVFVSRHAFCRPLIFRHDIESAIRDALSVPETEQARRAHFLLARIAGREHR